MTNVSRIDFGFPVNVTEEINFSEVEDFKKKDFSNKNLHLKINIEDKLGKKFNSEVFKKDIQDSVHCVNIKIDYIYNNESKERSREVAEADSVIDKAKKFAELNDFVLEESTISKIEDIQNNLLVNNFVPNDSFELEYISLRGSIGIWEGQHKEEISINFADDYSDGIIAISGENGSGKCVTGNSVILTDNGFERIDSYRLKNKKCGYTPFEKRVYVKDSDNALSSHYYTEKVNKTIKITNFIGMSVEGTPDHPILTLNKNCDYEFKKLRDITTDDYVCVPRGMNVFGKENQKLEYVSIPNGATAKDVKLPETMTPTLARFLGYYIANGSKTRNSIGFSSFNEDLCNDWKSCVKELFGLTSVKHHEGFYAVHSIVVKNFLKSIYKYPLKKARFKKVPACILGADRECQKAFITALFDCDSSLYKDVLEYSTASEQISDMIQNMLLNFGIVSIHREKFNKKYKWTYHIISIRSEQLDVMMKNVMDKSIKYDYKRSKPVNPNIDVIPYLKDFSKSFFNADRNGRFNENGTFFQSPLRFSNSINLTYRYLSGLVDRTRKNGSHKAGDFLKVIEKINNDHYFFAKVTNIQTINKPTVVYDFTIPSTHRFYSNGFISHNTTFLEMMNPYNSHLTRNGSLKDFFFLKDSHKILIYKNSAGRRFKISMFIDGKALSVMTMYKVEVMEPDSNVWTDGPEIKSADDYKKWAESVFGPKDMFLRTAFFTTKTIKSTPDLSIASKTEKMTLFSALAGIDYLSEFHEQAKLRIKDEEEIIEEIKSQLKDFDNVDYRLEEIGKLIVEQNQSLDNYKKLVEIDSEELEVYNEEQKKYLIAAGAFDILRTTLNEKEVKIDDNEREIAKINVAIASINEDLDDIDLYKEQYAWYESNVGKLKDLSEERNKLEALKDNARDALDKTIKENRHIEDEINLLKNEEYKLDIDIKSLSKSMPDINENCPVCGAPLSSHKKEELEKELKSIQLELDSKNLEKNKIINAISEKEKCFINIVPLEDNLKAANDSYIDVVNVISDINSYAENIDIDKVKDVLNNSVTKLDNLNAKKQSIIDENIQLEKDIENLRSKLTDIPTDYSDKIARLTRGIQDSQQNIANINAELSSLTREKNTLSQKEPIIRQIKEDIREHQQNIKDYTVIQNTFGNTGIQALELDSAAPEISDIANSILHASYGERFTIKFETQRATKNGKKTIDDFVINVFDSRSGSKKVLEDLSQGESLWIRQSLYYAFSVIRARRTGFCFKTRFLDESDGPLDKPSTRLRYLKMIEMAHKMSNASKTLLITHSLEIKEMLDQRFDM